MFEVAASALIFRCCLLLLVLYCIHATFLCDCARVFVVVLALNSASAYAPLSFYQFVACLLRVHAYVRGSRYNSVVDRHCIMQSRVVE